MPVTSPKVALCVGKPKSFHMPQMFAYMQAAWRRSLEPAGENAAAQLGLLWRFIANRELVQRVIYRTLRDRTRYTVEPPCQDQPQSLQESWQRQREEGHFGDCEDYVIAISAMMQMNGLAPGHWVYIGDAADPWMHVVNGFWVDGTWVLIDATSADGAPWEIPAHLGISNIVSPTGTWPGITFPLFTQHMQATGRTGTAGVTMKTATPFETANLTPREIEPPRIDCACPKPRTDFGMASSSVQAQGVGASAVAVPLRVLTDAQASAIDDHWTYDVSQQMQRSPGAKTADWERLARDLSGWTPILDHLSEQVEQAAVYRPDWLDWLFGDSATREDLHRVYQSNLAHIIQWWNTIRELLEYRLWFLNKLATSGDIERDRAMMAPVRGEAWAEQNYRAVWTALRNESTAIQAVTEAARDTFSKLEEVGKVFSAHPVPQNFGDVMAAFIVATGRVIGIAARALGEAAGAAADELVQGPIGLVVAIAALAALSRDGKKARTT